MHSMFRSPNDISDSDSTSGEDELNTSQGSEEEEEEENNNREVEADDDWDSPLSSSNDAADKNALGAEVGLGSTSEVDAEGHAALMTAALLEHYCMTRAVDILNEQPGNQIYTRQSPEAQLLGRRLYSSKSRVLSTHGVVAPGVDGKDWDGTRQYYRDTLDSIGISALEEDLGARRSNQNSRKAIVEDGFAALSLRNQRPKSIGRKLPGDNLEDEGGDAAINARKLITDGADASQNPGGSMPDLYDFFRQPQTPMPRPINLPYLYSQPYQQNVGVSRYTMEFEEQSFIGKGSFGMVYKVKHHVDGQLYAVKKIPLSSKRLRQLQDRGLQQVDSILKEIRTLAQLEHMNVVRYFGAWAEYSPATESRPDASIRSNIPKGLLSHQPTQDESEDYSVSNHGVVFEESDNGIVFEDTTSLSGADSGRPDHPNMQGTHRRSSQATHSSTKSRKSFVEDGTNGSEDDVESVPRSFNFPTAGQTSSFSHSGDDIFSDGMGENGSNLQLGRCRDTESSSSSSPTITLHIQMSLHPLSLAKYLYPQSERCTSNIPRHCYHIIPALKILLGVLSGVEYLHSKGIIHRDLKPANIFLSPPTTSDACSLCDHSGQKAELCYSTPRIGDFGLVAETSANESEKQHEVYAKHPVGTEFYRPPYLSNNLQQDEQQQSPNTYSAISSQPHESLDVYALGVILFELVYKLDTRMERQMVLSNLTCSPNSLARKTTAFKDQGLIPGIPADFATKIHTGCLNGFHSALEAGDGKSIADRLALCITKMVEPDPSTRWTCSEVRQHLEDMLRLVVKHG